ncbi:helix-turn-helix domain-containing protein [Kaistia defluvii]|uniref:XRE family transcriptional regulator n=1 Tax=Kaistia defluvii TaxID=410841 RepID=A0ABV2R0Z2_9HYPH
MTKKITEYGADADEDLPEEVLAPIENGATPLAAVRIWKGMSVDQLARLSSLSAAIITGAEGARHLSPEDQVKLAFVLGVGADLFYE